MRIGSGRLWCRGRGNVCLDGNPLSNCGKASDDCLALEKETRTGNEPMNLHTRNKTLRTEDQTCRSTITRSCDIYCATVYSATGLTLIFIFLKIRAKRLV